MTNQKSFTSTIDIIARLKPDEVISSAKKISDAFAEMNPSKEIQKQFGATLTGFAEALNRYKLKMAQGVNTNAEFKDLLSNGTQILRLYDKLEGRAENLKNLTKEQYRGLFTEEERKAISGMEKAIKEYEAAVAKSKKTQAGYTGVITKNNNAIAANKEQLAKVQKQTIISADAYDKLEEELNQARADYAALAKDAENAKEKLNAKESSLSQPNKSSEVRRMREEYKAAQEAAEAAAKVVKEQEVNIGNQTTEERKAQELKRLNEEIENYQKKIEEAERKQKELAADTSALTTLQEAFKQLGFEGEQLPKSFDEARNALNKLEGDAKATAEEAINKFINSIKEARGTVTPFRNELHGAAESFAQFNEQMKMSNEINRKVTQFFTAANAIRLFRRAVTSAFNTVKELDAAMTATAVVTDFDLDDLWGQMPKYTAQADKLGVAIKDVVEAQTLFYQQGLKTQQVEELSTQALKMARIAGLDAADATNKMTAALRGFNMELNQASAQNVADVYSQLAAITASDVEEISSAMTKTASIAHSAGMQFETTAAFLSQIIETTRESAETAGTALKTVIARFQELKKSPDEIGEVDGEIVDANKIEGALRTVGVSLRDASGQFRELDQVFLELSSKWDSLDKNTQRYIATIAAGSRQQSRFIAMMSDYKRTQDLVAAANNSAGAANRQYEKTLDSLDAKLKQLKTAWDEFTTSIANSEIIKKGVDLVTLLLKAINGLTNILPKGASGFAKLGIAMGALKIGGNIWKNFVQLKNTLGPINGLMAGTAKEFTRLGRKLGSFAQVLDNTDATNFWKGFGDAADIAQGHLKMLTAAQIQQRVQSQLGIEATKAYNEAVSAGIPPLTAATAVTDENVVAKINQIMADDSLTAEEKKLQIAEAATNGATARGIGTRWLAIKALLFGNQATRAAAMETLGLAKSEEIQAMATGKATVSQWGFNAALYACPLGWFLLIVGAVAAALVGLGFALYNASDAARMKQLNSEMEDLSKKVDTLKESIDNLAETKSKLDGFSDKFKGLVQGTTEWRQALYENNKEIVDLINKYPELERTIDAETGIYSISDESWKTLNNKLFNETTNATIQQGVNQQYQDYLEHYKSLESGYTQADAERRKIFNAYKATLPENIADNLQYGYFAQWRSQLGWNPTDDEIKLFFGVTAEEVEETKTAIEKAFQDIQKAYEEYDQAFIDSQQKYNEQNANFLLGSNEQASKSTYRSFYNTIAEEQVKDYQKIYKDAQSETSASENAGQEAVNQAIENDKEIIKEANELESTLIKRNDIIGQAILNIGNEGSNLTSEYVDALQQLLNSTDQKDQELVNQLKKLGIDPQSEVSLFEARKIKATEVLKNRFSLDNSLSLGNMKGLSEQFAIIMAESGADAAEALNNSLISTISSLNSAQKNEFVTLLNQTDWKDLSAWDSFKETLAEAGLDSLVNGLDEFITQAGLAAHAIKRLDFTKVEKDIKNLASVSRNIREGTQGRHFEDDVYETIKNANSELTNSFVVSIDGGYEFVGSMEALKKALTDLTLVEQDQLKQQLEQKVGAGEILEQLDSRYFDTEQVQGSTLRGNLKILYKSLSGIDKDLLGIAGLSNQEINWDMTDEQVAAVINKLSELRGSGLATNRANLNTTNTQLANLNQQQQRVTTQGVNVFNRQASPDSFIATLSALGVSEAGINQYRTMLDQLKALEKQVGKTSPEYKKLNKEVAILERNLANDASIIQTNERLKDLFTHLTENAEAYETLTEDQMRWANIQDSASNFGIYLDNADQANRFQSLLTQVLTGGTQEEVEQAWLNIIQMAAEDAGVRWQEWGRNISEAFAAGMDANNPKWVLFAEELAKKGVVTFTDEFTKEGAHFSLGAALMDAQTNYGPKDKTWENPYTWLYNINQRINRQIKDREAAERAYNRAVEDSVKTTQDLVASSKRELDLLAGQQRMYEYRTQNAQKELEKWREGEYGKYFDFDPETGRYLGVKPGEIKKVENGDYPDIIGENIETVEARLQEIQDAWDEGNEELENIDDQVKEIRNRGREQYIEFEKRVLSNLVSYYTQQIDELETIGQTIEDTNSKLISSIQETVAKQRQERQNQETEQNLSDKQRRLAYLQMDTSGANQTEILKLQDELAKDQQSYTDTLVDQAIDEMQKANQVAQEQREQQISIMRSQLQYAQDSGALWGRVEELMNLGLDENGLKVDSELVTLFKTQEGWSSLSEIQQQDWMDSLKNDAKLAELFRSKEILEYLQTAVGDFTKEGVEPLVTLKSISSAINSAKDTLHADLEKLLEERDKTPGDTDSNTNGKPIFYGTGATNTIRPGTPFSGATAATDTGTGHSGYMTNEEFDYSRLQNFINQNKIHPGTNPEQAIGYFDDYNHTYRNLYKNLPDYLKKQLRWYATGGLADFTGPAWLDGTPSQPELVLNSKDTQNFIALRDILSNLANNGTSIGGDTYYDIDIDVDSLQSDYDVEQLADKIRSMIAADATYRNVNTLNRLR